MAKISIDQQQRHGVPNWYVSPVGCRANRRSGSFVAVLAQYIAIAIEDGVVKVSRALWNVARSISYIGIGRVLYVAYLFCHQKSVKVAEAV